MNKLILMKLNPVVVYNLTICVKGDNTCLKYFKRDNE